MNTHVASQNNCTGIHSHIASQNGCTVASQNNCTGISAYTRTSLRRTDALYCETQHDSIKRTVQMLYFQVTSETMASETMASETMAKSVGKLQICETEYNWARTRSCMLNQASPSQHTNYYIIVLCYSMAIFSLFRTSSSGRVELCSPKKPKGRNKQKLYSKYVPSNRGRVELSSPTK